MFSKKLSVLVFVLMSTFIECQTKDSICNFLLENGRVRDLGLYRFVSKEGISSYRLFKRVFDESPEDKVEEQELVMENWSVSAQPLPILDYYGFHKFYAGYGKSFTQACRADRTQCSGGHFNCRIELIVSLLQGMAILCKCCLKVNQGSTSSADSGGGYREG